MSSTSSVPPCTVIVHVAGDSSPPSSPTISADLPPVSPTISSYNFLRPPGMRPFYRRTRPSLNDFYPHLRPAWKAAEDDDEDSDTLTLVPVDSIDFDPDYAPDQPWHKRWKAKAKACAKARRGISGRVLFCGAVFAIVVLRGVVCIIKLACLPFAHQEQI